MERIQFDRSSASPVRFSVDASVDPTTRKAKGYAAVWGVVGSQPGELSVFPAGSCVLPSYPVVLMYNHNSDWHLATEDNGSLLLAQDDHGLAITGMLGTSFIEDYVVAKMADRTIRGMSLGMYPIKQHKESRTITSVDAQGNPELGPMVGKSVSVTVYDRWLLDEVTITGRPVFPQTNVGTFSRENGADVDSYRREAELIGLVLD